MRGGWRNIRFSHSWTEDDPRVINFIRETLHEEPIKVEIGNGCDFTCGGANIEVKSCSEWIKARQSNGKRRRGQFGFFGHEKADFILFVLILDSGELKMKLLTGETIDERIGKGRLAFSWLRIFPEKGGSIEIQRESL